MMTELQGIRELNFYCDFAHLSQVLMFEANLSSSIFSEHLYMSTSDSPLTTVISGFIPAYIAGATVQPLIPSTWNLNTSKNVSWQTAWWSLVPLVIAAMTQPCGSVLGRKDKNFRFYCRASPIICIVDVFYFLGCLALSFTFDGRVFLRNIKFELRERFSEDEANLDSYADAERTRLARWTLLIIGGMPCQTIKLAVMDGMFWTKFWAMSFFGSIVFWEVIILLSKLLQRNHAVQLPTPIWRQEPSRLARIMHSATSISLASHFFAVYTAATTLFYWALFSVSDLQFRHALAITAFLTIFITLSPIIIQHLRGHRFIDDIPLMLLTLLVMVLAVVTTTATRVFTPDLFSAHLENWNRMRPPLEELLRHQRNPPKSPLADILIPWTEIALGIRTETAGHVIFRISEVVTGTVFCLSIPRVFYLSILRSLFRVDSAAGSYAVFIFVSTFLFSLLWYCFMFQPFGTYLPDWTEVFG